MLQCNLLLFKLRYLRSDVRLFCFIKKLTKYYKKNGQYQVFLYYNIIDISTSKKTSILIIILNK